VSLRKYKIAESSKVIRRILDERLVRFNKFWANILQQAIFLKNSLVDD